MFYMMHVGVGEGGGRRLIILLSTSYTKEGRRRAGVGQEKGKRRLGGGQMFSYVALRDKGPPGVEWGL